MQVAFSRVFEVEAESQSEAREKAEKEMLEVIENKGSMYFNTDEYKEPLDWKAQAHDQGLSLASDIEDEIAEAVKSYREDHADEIKEAHKEGNEYDEDSDEVREIWDDIYQDVDTYHRATEYADGSFIYRSTDAVIEALQCINELSDYEETDRGLWEGTEEVEDIINIKATYTLSHAIHAEAEKEIKERIADALNSPFCGVCFKNEDADGRCGCTNQSQK